MNQSRIGPLIVTFFMFCVPLGFAAALDSKSSPPPALVTNLGLASDLVHGLNQPEYAQLHGGRATFWVNEGEQGIDLNGDGDLFDEVLHLHNFYTGATTNLQSTSRVAVLSGTRFLFGVNETLHDLNGDGDTQDPVLFLHDFSTSITTNLALASNAAEFADGLVIAVVAEFAQGNTDLNGDGDTFDGVFHVHDVATGLTSNLGVAEASLLGVETATVAGGLASFYVDEMAQGNTDLNGDGDTQDWVPHVYNRAGPALTNLGHAYPGCCAEVPIVGQFAVFVVGETADGMTDWNGDGDVVDEVLFTFDSVSGVTSNLGLPTVSSLQEVAGARLAFSVDESKHGGTDLNGDGDASDCCVLHVFDGTAGVLSNLGIAAAWGDLVFEGDGLAFQRHEETVDLNGDGDTADAVVQVYDFGTGTVINLGLAGRPAAISGSTAALLVHEAAQGNTDLDGDGVVGGTEVLHLQDLSTGITTNLGLSAFLVQADGELMLLLARETAIDFNGDGDTDDDVLQLHMLASGATFNFSLATRYFYLVDGPRLLFSVRESAQGATDLNGDGDALDEVAHVAEVFPGGCGSIQAYGHGCPGTAGTTPDLLLSGCPRPGLDLTLRIVNGLANAAAFLVFGQFQASIPLIPGCTLNVTPLLPPVLGPLSLSSTGSTTLSVTVPPGTPLGTVTMQAFIQVVGGGYANTNGIELTLQN